MYSDFARYEDESLNIEWNITLKKTNKLLSLTPKNVFHVMKYLYGFGKNAEKNFNSVKTQCFFYEFLMIVRSALFQNKTERIAFLFGTVFA